MSAEEAPPDGEDVARVVPTPVVEGAEPAVERDVDLVAADGADRRRTDEVRVLAVDRLQLHARLEAVSDRPDRRLQTRNTASRWRVITERRWRYV